MAFHDRVQFNARLIMKRTILENCKQWLVEWHVFSLAAAVDRDRIGF